MPEQAPTPPLGRLRSVETWALRAPIATPVVTSFGTMRDRPAVVVRVTADDGAQGWGEAWCNFPGVGAEHRARLLIDTVAPLALSQSWPDVGSLFRTLEARLRVLGIQTGEPGPLAQCVCALDLAAWDLAARRAGQPLWQALGGAGGWARVYASGLHPDEAIALSSRMHDRGHRAFKMKVGFVPSVDLRRLRELRAALGDAATLMLDANQAWSPDVARERIAALAVAGPVWMEEPIAADHPPQVWAALAADSGLPLAAGENLRGTASFDAVLGTGALAFVQPDVGKWGGLTGCRAVAQQAPLQGAQFCPHWLGGPLGLMASMHLRAAMGEGGWVEWDANPNPIHDRVADQLPVITEGAIDLGAAPGLGLELHPSLWADLVSWQGVARAAD